MAVSREHRRDRIIGAAICVFAAAAVVGAAVAFVIVEGRGLPTSTPSCSWPLRVHGKPNREQVGLIRCYVKALATRDISGMQAVADEDPPPPRITGAQFYREHDARTGEATLTLVANSSDSAYYTANITFADGASVSLPLVIANPQAESWRLQIGEYPPDKSDPPGYGSKSQPSQGAS